MKKDAQVHCRLCGSARTENLGSIPDCGEFAGRSVSPSIRGGHLISCRDCASLFRAPLLPQAQYLELYQNAPDVAWERHQEARNDFRMVRDCLSNLGGGTVLDIGCGSGLLLRSLPAGFRKFGVEPSDAAAAVARSHGIDMLGKTIAEVDPDKRFNILLAIDVVEHVIDVNEFMGNALRHLKAGGLFILTTGNPDHRFFKNIFKARFWYASFSEHLTFPSMKYFAGFCKKAGLAQPSQRRFSYLKRSAGVKIVLGIAQILFWVSPATFRFSERMFRKIVGMAKRPHPEFGLSAGGAFEDHQLIVIKNEKEKYGSLA